MTTGTKLFFYRFVVQSGIVTNPVHDLTLAHHIDACTTLLLHITHGLHFPSTIALITQLSPITHCTDYTAESNQTLFISLELPLSHGWVLFCYCRDCWVFSLCEFPVDYLDCLYSSDRLLPAYLTLPACFLDILSVCRLHRPLHCPWLCISLAFVILVTVDWTLPVWPLV